MKTPPEMLSPKDCSYISDLLETILTTTKKANCYSQDVTDKKISKFCSEINTELANQYRHLVSLLK